MPTASTLSNFGTIRRCGDPQTGAAVAQFTAAADDGVDALDVHGNTLLVGGYELAGAGAPLVALGGPGVDVGALAIDGRTLAAGGSFAWLDGARPQALRVWRTKAPASTAPPQVGGTPLVGRRLACTDGTWTGDPTGYEKAWLRDGAPIPGATGDEYVATEDDADHLVACAVTAVNERGSATATSAAVEVHKPASGGGTTPTPTPTATPPASPTAVPTVAPPAPIAVRATCARASRRAVRCDVAPAKPVLLELRRRGRTVAVAAGSGSITLRAERRLRSGRYALIVSAYGRRTRIAIRL